MQRRSSDTVKIFYPRYSKDEVVRILRERAGVLSKIKNIKKVVLFGSYAEGRYTAASDIDVLIIYEDEDWRDVYDTAWDIFNISEIEIHLMSLNRYTILKKERDPFIKYIEEKGIVVWSSLE